MLIINQLKLNKMKKNLTLFLLINFNLVINSQTLISNQPSFYVSGTGSLPSNPSQLFDGNLTTPAQLPGSYSGCCSPARTSSGVIDNTFSSQCMNWNLQKGYFASGSEMILDVQRTIINSKVILKACGLASGCITRPSALACSNTYCSTYSGSCLGGLGTGYTSFQFNTPSSSTFQIQIFTGASVFGPWQQIKDTSLVISGQNIDFSIPIDNKASRFFRIYFPSIQAFTQTINATYKINSTPPYDRYYNWNCSQTVNSLSIGEIEFYESSPLITSSTSNPLINGECVTLTAAASGETYLWSTGEITQSITVCNSGTYTCQVTNTSFTGNQDYTASLNVSTIGAQDNWSGPNGEVYTIHRNGNSVYYGGDFNAVGPVTGSSAQISEISGAANITMPRVYGTVNVTLPDGNGGWYIGGTFNRVGNYNTVSNLAHINANGSVDLNFKPVPNGAVYTLAMYGSNLYVGGEFTTIKGLVNNYIAKIDKANGTPLFWNAYCNNTVRTMQLYADKIILGGNFTSIGGATRNYLGVLDTTYLQVTTWAPNPNAAVYKLLVNGTKLYVGGDFTNISGVAKGRGAGYTLPGFTIDPYDFAANNRIHDFAFYNNVLYTAGKFTTIGGAARNYIAGLNYLNVLANSFNANADSTVYSLSVLNGNLIAGGSFSNIGGAPRSRLASLNVSSGAANAWNPNVVGIKGTNYNVLSLATNSTNIFAGGTFCIVGASARNNVAAVDATTGSLLPFDANTNNIVRSVYADGNYLYMGGDFTTVNGSINKNRIAQVNGTTGIATGWNPNADGSVNALALSGTNLFVGGAFANIGGGARAKIASLSTLTGGASAFNPTANNNINALTTSGDTLFIGGVFTTIGGQTRNRVAAYRISTSGLLSIDPNANNTVNALAVKGNKLYIGGNFTSISNTAINSLAEFNVTTNNITSLNTGIANTTTVNALATADSSLYSGGGFSYANCGQTIDNAAVIKTLSNRVSFWIPQPDDIVRVIYLAPDKAYIGGKFKVIQRRYQPFFATTDLFNSGNPPTVASISSTTACVNETITITGTGFTGVTSVSVGSNSVPFTVVSSTIITITPSVAVTGAVNISNTLGNATGNQTLTVNALPIASLTTSGSATFCQGNSLVLNANTGVGLTYQWKNNGTIISAATLSSYTASVAGNYAVTITNNNNCSATSNTINVTVYATPTLAVSNATICSGNSANIAATGATTYSWNTGATTSSISVTPTTTSNYIVIGTTNGCANTNTVSVTVNQLPIVNLGSIQSPLCVNNSSVSLSGTPLGGVFAGIGVSGASFNPAISGAGTFTINYTYTDANNCSAAAIQSVNVSLCTGIIELDSDTISIFPNPASTEITITSPIKFTSVKIVNSIGQIVQETKYNNTVSVVELTKGIYFLQLFNENGNLIMVKKFIKE